ncbi:MAG: BtrH N-terminal domain-containing protein [Oscillochloris sp.]|nr:BtrH N-terminal domain-containing protein [Oscillochloris sp.]
MAHTGFKPEVNGFAFINSWKLDKGEKQQLRQQLSNSIGEASHSAAGGFGGLLGNQIGPQLDAWIDAALPDYYGMCGGMAFAAADHFIANKPLPRGEGRQDIPENNTPRGRALRDYLWQRQIQSLQLNGPQLLHWMIMLHLPLPFAGPGWLLSRTREEWAKLKEALDRGKPWPLCLIGSSLSPFNNHQVLATGYDDQGDQRGVIYVYDMNDPGKDQTIALDMRGSALAAIESVPNHERGPLQAFFCERYTPVELPVLPEE